MYDANDVFLECKRVLHNYTKLKQRRSFNNKFQIVQLLKIIYIKVIKNNV